MLVNSNRHYEQDGHADLPASPFLLMSASNMCSGRIGSLYGTNIGNA